MYSFHLLWQMGIMIYGPKTEYVVNNHQLNDGQEVGKGDRKTK